LVVLCFAAAGLSGRARAQCITYEQQTLTASNPQSFDSFGLGCAVQDDVAVASRRGDQQNTGSAIVYRLQGATWVEEQEVTASDGVPDDLFGTSLD
jgi:hypothetical protein